MEGPDPGGEGDNPTVTIVHKIKCRLGYAELHKPAPGFGPGEAVSWFEVTFERRQTDNSPETDQIQTGLDQK